jgi:protein-tyrosine phosphatase
MDDGSRSMEDSIKVIRNMAAGGISEIYCTPHYMRGRYQFEKSDYRVKYSELIEEVKHQQIPVTLYPGAEVFLINGITDDIKAKNLTMGDSNYVLVETELNGFPPDLYNNLYELLHKGYRPILAHAERYVSVMTRTHEVKHLIAKNIYIQMNAGSLMGGYGDKVKTTAWKLINKGWVHMLASDEHVRGENNAYFLAREKIVEHVDEKTAKLLTDSYPRCIIEKSRIPFSYVSVQVSRRKSKLRWLKRFFGF